MRSRDATPVGEPIRAVATSIGVLQAISVPLPTHARYSLSAGLQPIHMATSCASRREDDASTHARSQRRCPATRTACRSRRTRSNTPVSIPVTQAGSSGIRSFGTESRYGHDQHKQQASPATATDPARVGTDTVTASPASPLPAAADSSSLSARADADASAGVTAARV